MRVVAQILPAVQRLATDLGQEVEAPFDTDSARYAKRAEHRPSDGIVVAGPSRIQEDLGLDSNTSVGKALSLLNSFTPTLPAMGVTEIARRARLPKSTAHRLLSVLVDWEFVTKRGSSYAPGHRLSELAPLAENPFHSALRRLTLPHMLDLYEATHEAVNLCVLTAIDVHYIESLHGHRRCESPTSTGARLLAANTAAGKAILAFSADSVIARASRNLRPATSWSIKTSCRLSRELAEIRSSSVAYDHQETRPGLTCIAAPIRDWTGEAVAALSITGPAHRFRPTQAAPVIRAAAARASNVMQAAS